jgi:hypothetical protein
MRSLEAKASATEASLPSLKAAADAALSAWQKGSADFMRKCVMQGKIDGDTFVVMDSFALPVEVCV